MSNLSDCSRSSDGRHRPVIRKPSTPRGRSNSRLRAPLISPIPLHRLSPAIDEFSLRRTPSRGATASPAPAKGVRKRLHQYRNLDHAVDLLKRSRNIVVLTGAGISTSVGIPDFRSDKGLYSQLSKDLGITEAEEFFSRDYFVQNTDQFFQYVRRVIPEAVVGNDGVFKSTNPGKESNGGTTTVPEFSPTHAFLALLHAKRKLLTNYTQNIDGLESAAGVPRTKFIQCHGSWDTASCMTCGKSSAARKYLPVVFSGNVPFCKCKLEKAGKSKKKHKTKTGKKRSWEDFDSDHSSDDGTQAPRGLLKPDITFFNERLSGAYDDRLNEDKRKIDLLIIIGTSLKVGPVQDMLYQISARVPQIFISKERFSGALCNLPGVQVDIELLGECDVIIEELCYRAGWMPELEALSWEKGQMKTKGLDPTIHGQRIDSETADAAHTTTEPQRKTENEHKRQKILISPDHAVGAKNTESIHGNEKDRPLSGLATTTVTAVKDNGWRISEVSVQKSDDKENAQIEPESQGNKSLSEPSTDGAATAPDVRVKIELVEGTAHQWRIGRK